MLTDIHLASKRLSMNLSKTKVILNENATTSTVTVDGNTIEKVDRYDVVYHGKTVTQAGDLLPEIKKRIAVGWATFSKVANIMKSMKASMNKKRKVHNEYVVPVKCVGPYGSETWALKKAHMELLSVAQRKMERIILGITLRDHNRNTWILYNTRNVE